MKQREDTRNWNWDTNYITAQKSPARRRKIYAEKQNDKRYLRRSTLKLAQSIGFIIGEMEEKAKVFCNFCFVLLISLWLWAFFTRDKHENKFPFT